MIYDPSLLSVLSLGWTVMYVAAVWSVVFWALGQRDQQSELVKNLTGGSVARGKCGALDPGQGGRDSDR